MAVALQGFIERLASKSTSARHLSSMCSITRATHPTTLLRQAGDVKGRTSRICLFQICLGDRNKKDIARLVGVECKAGRVLLRLVPGEGELHPEGDDRIDETNTPTERATVALALSPAVCFYRSGSGCHFVWKAMVCLHR